MDARFLALYEAELRHVRGMGKEFAHAHPEVAGRLGLDELDCADPYVERLIESFAFLTARIQLQLDREFPRFTQHLLELVYPGYLSPTPSMAVVQILPDFGQPLASGHALARGTELRVSAPGGVKCEFRTVHPVTLWPVELTDAAYHAVPPRVIGGDVSARAAFRIRLRARQPLSDLRLDALPIFLPGADDTAARSYETLLSSTVALAARPLVGGVARGEFSLVHRASPHEPVTAPYGFDESESMFLCDDADTSRGTRRFRGYRLLEEYFAFPQRFMFVELCKLAGALSACGAASELELLLLLDWASPGMANGRSLEGAVTGETFRLYCTPAVNLFRKSAEPILLRERAHEHVVVPDASRLSAYEVHSVAQVVGRLGRGGGSVEFTPLYTPGPAGDAHFTLERRPSPARPGPSGRGAPEEYAGSDVLLALIDGLSGPFRTDLRHLEVATWCTNRGLPLRVTRGSTFSCQSDRAVAQVVCVAGPTRPHAAPAEGAITWHLIHHLALNYGSLVDDDAGAPPLRRLLDLYAQAELGDPTVRRRVDGLQSVRTSRVVRPLPGEPLCYGRGVQFELRCDDTAYEGSGPYLLSAVLERFFARYASINAFTETVLHTVSRGEVMRWPMRAGRRQLL